MIKINKNKKGFTLIELLVVIAIIGILTTIALISFQSARQKARDASAKGSITSIRPASFLYFDDNNSFTGVCGSEEVAGLLTSAGLQLDADPVCDDTVSPDSFTVFATLNSTDSNDDPLTYCVDADGFAGVPPAFDSGLSC
jgi:prepilin-type N-terminal cleavage/methylation domain-containing protein